MREKLFKESFAERTKRLRQTREGQSETYAEDRSINLQENQVRKLLDKDETAHDSDNDNPTGWERFANRSEGNGVVLDYNLKDSVRA
ncbi:MAG: hypothetical protein ACOYNL_10520 [Rickettsiales bacterium]